MATTISGTNGVSQVQDGIVTQGKLAAASVTDGKLDLTANSAEVKEATHLSMLVEHGSILTVLEQ
jgi:hypothetical protein